MDYPNNCEVEETSLLEDVVQKMKEEKEQDTFSLAKKMLGDIESGNVQIYFNDGLLQQVISDIEWYEGTAISSCDNCFIDVIKPTEANLSDANSRLVDAEFELETSVEESVTKNILTIYLNNRNDEEYWAYWKVLVNGGSGFSKTEVVDELEKGNVVADLYPVGKYKEAGVFVELKPKETKAILFSWEEPSGVDFEREGKYWIYFKRQAGSQERKTTIRVRLASDNLEVGSFSLTEEGTFEYNTSLKQDLVLPLDWYDK